MNVEVEPRGLPAEDNGGTFDTIGSALFFSSDQFENYLKIGRSALNDAIVTVDRPAKQIVHREPEEAVNKSKRAEHEKAVEKVAKMRGMAQRRETGDRIRFQVCRRKGGARR